MTKKSKKAKQTLMNDTAATPISNPAETSSSENLQNSSSNEPSSHWSTRSSTTVAIYDVLCQLESRIVTLEIKVEEMQAAVKDTNEKEKVAALGTKVKDLQEAVTNKPFKNKIATIECELSNIKKMIRNPEQSKLSRKTCAICNKTFLKNSDLEQHTIEEHNSPKDFECTVCGKKFFLEWRMKKHARMHTVTPRICRYFSTKIACPFVEIGCKFSHTFIPDPATCHVARNENAEQTQFQYYNAALQHGQAEPEQPLHYYHTALQHGHEEQPQPQHGHGHAEQPQHHLAAVHGHGVQPQPHHHHTTQRYTDPPYQQPTRVR